MIRQPWPGLIEAYRDRVPVPDGAQVVTLGEGNTPLLPARPIAETPTRYHVSLDVADKPGVLAAVAHEFAEHGVSIATVRQDGHGDAATLVLVTHSAPDAALSATVEALQEMPAVRGVTSVLRVEGLT